MATNYLTSGMMAHSSQMSWSPWAFSVLENTLAAQRSVADETAWLSNSLNVYFNENLSINETVIDLNQRRQIALAEQIIQLTAKEEKILAEIRHMPYHGSPRNVPTMDCDKELNEAMDREEKLLKC